LTLTLPPALDRFHLENFHKIPLALKSALSSSVIHTGKTSKLCRRRRKRIVQKIKWMVVLVMWFAAVNLSAQNGRQVVDTKDRAPLDELREKRAWQPLLKIPEKLIVPAVDAMPADKFGFAPTDGEFQGVRTFGQMVKHLSATNHILAAAALGEEPPQDAGDEVGPEAVRTKAEILNYLKGSFVHLSKAIEAIGPTNAPVN